jgi:hypothetical protein
VYGYDPAGRDGKAPANVKRLEGVPPCEFGAPLPAVMADDWRVTLFYVVEEIDEDWDGMTVSVIGSNTPDRGIAVIRFARPHAHFLGPPDEEVIHTHPYAALGLSPCNAFEVEHSDWIAALCARSRRSSRHAEARFEALRHFIFTFHDTTFEILANGFELEIQAGASILTARQAEHDRWANA